MEKFELDFKCEYDLSGMDAVNLLKPYGINDNRFRIDNGRVTIDFSLKEVKSSKFLSLLFKERLNKYLNLGISYANKYLDIGKIYKDFEILKNDDFYFNENYLKVNVKKLLYTDINTILDNSLNKIINCKDFDSFHLNNVFQEILPDLYDFGEHPRFEDWDRVTIYDDKIEEFIDYCKKQCKEYKINVDELFALSDDINDNIKDEEELFTYSFTLSKPIMSGMYGSGNGRITLKETSDHEGIVCNNDYKVYLEEFERKIDELDHTSSDYRIGINACELFRINLGLPERKEKLMVHELLKAHESDFNEYLVKNDYDPKDIAWVVMALKFDNIFYTDRNKKSLSIYYLGEYISLEISKICKMMNINEYEFY